MKLSKKIIFDFDGVICDSTFECLYVAYNSYLTLKNKNPKLIDDINLIDKNFIKQFVNLRSNIRGADQFLPLIEFIINKEKIINLENKLNRKNKQMEEFKKIFYEIRLSLRQSNPDKWLSLHKFEEDIIKYLLNLIKQEKKILIATLKDKESILFLLKSKNIMPNNLDILDKDDIENKEAAINIFKKKYCLNYSEFIFIDDNVNHLISLNKHNYKTALASWFAKNTNFIKVAIKKKIPVYSKFEILREELIEKN